MSKGQRRSMNIRCNLGIHNVVSCSLPGPFGNRAFCTRCKYWILDGYTGEFASNPIPYAELKRLIEDCRTEAKDLHDNANCQGMYKQSERLFKIVEKLESP